MVPLGALALLNLWFAYQEAEATAMRMQDRLLLGSARIIAQQIQVEDGVLEVAIPPAALELFQSTDQDRVYYRIADARGVLLSGYAELPPSPHPPGPEESSFFDARVRDHSVRVVAYAQPVFGVPGVGPVQIQVAQTDLGRRRLVRDLWIGSIRQETWMLGLVAILAWLSVGIGLKDLLRLRSQMQERSPGSLEPLDPGPIPRELEPLVNALNGYVQRLDAQVAQRNRFIANAAHQLRTPFTVLQTQATFGLRNPDAAAKDEALKAIFQGVRQGTRLVNQLLSLSMAEAGTHARPSGTVDLADLAQHVLEEHGALAQSKGIDLGYDPPGGRVDLAASRSMLHELASNLVDNALRYTPPGGIVTVSVRGEGSRAILQVEDNGPGIPAEYRERVFERFFRLQEPEVPGCGLGLSIVQELAASLGAEVRLSEPTSGPGLVVTVAFPAGGTRATGPGGPS